MSIRLFLIRHGETDYSRDRKYCGRTDPPLNKNGLAQARRLSLRFKGARFNKVYSSASQRAIQTAKVVFNGAKVEESPDFCEMDFGIFEGLRYGDILKKYPQLYNNWMKDTISAQVPGGEGLNSLRDRVLGRLKNLLVAAAAGEKIGLVCHGGPIRVILCSMLRQKPNVFWQIKQDLTALNIIDYPKGGTPVLLKMNDARHLSNNEASIL